MAARHIAVFIKETPQQKPNNKTTDLLTDF